MKLHSARVFFGVISTDPGNRGSTAEVSDELVCSTDNPRCTMLRFSAPSSRKAICCRETIPDAADKFLSREGSVIVSNAVVSKADVHHNDVLSMEIDFGKSMGAPMVGM